MKKYFLEFGFSMVLYVVTLFLSQSFVISHPASTWVIWVSLLPVVPAIMATVAVIRQLARFDELQQRIQFVSFAISFAIVGLGTFTYGFLENAGYPHIPYVWIFPFMIAVWGIVTFVVARVYK